jgi:hypothetical protein
MSSSPPVALSALVRIAVDFAVRALIRSSNPSIEQVRAQTIISVCAALQQVDSGDPVGAAALASAVESAIGSASNTDPGLADVIQTLADFLESKVVAIAQAVQGTLTGALLAQINVAVLGQAITIAQQYLPPAPAPVPVVPSPAPAPASTPARSLKLGRRRALYRRDHIGRALVLRRALAPLGSPPQVSSDYVSAVMRQASGGWGMMLNDQLGCCVASDSGHELMLRTANAGSIVIPSDSDVLALYEAVGGYVPGQPDTDQGCDEGTMCDYLVSTGLCGHKDAATVPIDPTNLDHLRWSVQLFGACRLGIIVDDRMLDEFNSGQAWTQPADPNDPNAGGHDVPIVRYDKQYAYVVTWGQLQAVAWGLVANAAFLDEAHASVDADFVQTGGTGVSGFDLPTLLADLQALQAPQQQAA